MQNDAPAAIAEQEGSMGISPMRWYCLLICCGVASMQGGYWNNFGPIAEAVKPFYGWHDSDIALLANWGPIMFLLFAIPFTWLMDVKGVKPSCVVSAFLLLIGCICRVVHVKGDRTGSYLMHAGQMFTDIPGPVAMGIGPLLAAAWFPPNERTIATCICAVVNYGGSAAMFVFGPMVVKQGEDVEVHLWQYMMGQLVLSVILLVGALCMPAKPPLPPSASARVTRTTMLAGFNKLSKQPSFWPVALSYGLIAGFLGGFGSQLGPNMGHVLPADSAEDDAGWMGFWGAVAGMIAGVGFGLISDRMTGKKKPLIMAACGFACLSFLIFACLCSGFLGNGSSSPGFMAALYATSILAALFCNAMIPLFFEMSVEAAYPISEGVTINVLTVVSNIATFIFLGVQSVPNIGTAWMNWACAAACIVPIILMTRLPEHQYRLEFDKSRAGTGVATLHKPDSSLS